MAIVGRTRNGAISRRFDTEDNQLSIAERRASKQSKRVNSKNNKIS
jgi:hypothetical protein